MEWNIWAKINSWGKKGNFLLGFIYVYCAAYVKGYASQNDNPAVTHK